MSQPHRTFPRRGLGAVTIVMPALALTVAACGTSTSPRATGGARPDQPRSGATFTGTIYVRTATSHVTRAFTERVAGVASCVAAASTGDAGGAFRVPSPAAPDPRASIEVADFHGPGTYTPRMLSRDRADSVLLTGTGGTSQYVITSPAAASAGKEVLYLRKDGSGQLDYTGAHLNGRATSPAVSGLILWSCTS
jgi:hypothetical protein